MNRILISEAQGLQLAEAAGYRTRPLAALMGISVRQLERDVRKLLGKRPQQWLDETRLTAAKQLLLEGNPVKKVAFDLRFKQVSHFCRKFKNTFDLTPAQFVVRAQSNDECRREISIVVTR